MKPFQECMVVQQLQAICRRLSPEHHAFTRLYQQFQSHQVGTLAEKDVMFYLSQLPSATILHNIRLLYHQQAFQMDYIVLDDERLSIIEVKGYRGVIVFQHQENRCFYEQERGEEEIANPLLQVERHRVLLRQHLRHHGWNDIPINVYVTFPHKTTVRQQGGRKEAIIRDEAIAQQLLTTAPTGRSIPRRAIGEYLVASHRERIVNLLADWNIERADLRHGLLCQWCGEEVKWQRRTWHCLRCEKTQVDVIERNIAEYVLLFGNRVKLKEMLHFFNLKYRKTLWTYLKKYERVGTVYIVK